MTARRLLIGISAILALLLAVALLLFIDRARADEALQRAVATEPANAAEALARAGIVATRFCVFGPYATDDVIANELGFDWPGASAQTGIGMIDSHELVVAEAEDRVVAWAMVPRPTGSALLTNGEYGCEPTG